MLRLPAGSSRGFAIPLQRPPTVGLRSQSSRQLPVLRYAVRKVICARAEISSDSHRPKRWQQVVAGSLLAAYLWACPCTDAVASVGLASIRQAEEVVGKISNGTSGRTFYRFLDKVFSVVTGQTAAVSPEALEKDLKKVISGDEQVREEWKKEFVGRLRNVATSVAEFDPFSFTKSAGTTVQGLIEAAGGAAENFAAYELSSLVSLGERWFVFTPIVAIPMAIEMNRVRRSRLQASDDTAAETEEEVFLKGELVRQELRRLALKSQLLNLVVSMGDLALQPSRNSSLIQSKQLRTVVEELAELNTATGDADVVGNWRLIYVSERQEARPRAQPEFDRIAGFELRNYHQSFTLGNSASSSSPGPGAVHNSAELDLGPLGVLGIAIQGRWESLQEGQSALVSFDHISVVPKQILGRQVGPGLPAVTVGLPTGVQQTGELQLLYVDDRIRINRGASGQLYVFQLAESAS